MHLRTAFLLAAPFVLRTFVQAQSMAIGGGHGVAVCADSTVMTWGWNLSGQLGNGYPTLTGDCQCFTYVAPVMDVDSVVAVTAGDFHTVVLLRDGRVREWGFGGSGALGYGFIPMNTCQCAALPVSPVGLPPIIKVAAGRDHTLAIAADSTVWTWGNNGSGQLGDGIGFAVLEPVHVAGLSGVVAIGAGDRHSLAVTRDGHVWAWGANDHGQLGDTTHTQRLAPVEVYGLSDVVAVDGGDIHSVALKRDGTVWAWGDNSFNVLQDTTVADTAAPVQVPGISNVRAIASGWYHLVALRNDSTVWSWGSAYYGQMGDGTNDLVSYAPHQADGLSGVVEIAAQRNTTLALQRDGTLHGWGYNYYAQLGDGTRLDKHTPVQVINLCPAAIALGTSDPAEVHRTFSIAPNPSDGAITLTTAVPAARYRLIALTGRIAREGSVQGGRVDAQRLDAGCYVLEAYDVHGTLLGRTRMVKE